MRWKRRVVWGPGDVVEIAGDDGGKAARFDLVADDKKLGVALLGIITGSRWPGMKAEEFDQLARLQADRGADRRYVVI